MKNLDVKELGTLQAIAEELHEAGHPDDLLRYDITGLFHCLNRGMWCRLNAEHPATGMMRSRTINRHNQGRGWNALEE